MKALACGTCAFALCACGMLLSGCGSAAGLPAGRAQADAANGTGDLVYVAGEQNRGVVSILTFPQGQTVATIALGAPTGLCSDASGNVWVVARPQKIWNAYEFAHGGTKTIAQIRLGNENQFFGASCAVDPTNGNLAIENDQPGSNGGFIDIYPGGKQGTPAVYKPGFTPVGCAYDDAGNLFVDGYLGSTIFFALAELPKGGGSFKRITLDKPEGFPGDVAWDGKYIAVQTGAKPPSPRIYRVQVTSSGAKVVQTVRPDDLNYEAWFAVKDKLVVGTRKPGHGLDLWAYPAGGKPAKELTQAYKAVTGVTISVAR
jgi:hypothetical protein